MGIRRDENYSNRSKYSAQDNAERLLALSEQELANDEYEATCKAKYAERKSIVVTGLVSKYGFSQAGATQAAEAIARGENNYGERAIDAARFATPEMKQAALKAFQYYWK